MKLQLAISILAMLLTNVLSAQNELAIGQWKSHLPYGAGKYLTQSDTRVYYATDFSILSIDKNTFEPTRISKVEGLSDVGVSVLDFNKEANALIVAYNSSIVDIVTDTEIIAVFDIKNFQGILGAKEIYDIYSEDAENIYFSANYGVSKFNILTREFAFTTFTNGIKVNATSVYNDFVYIATDDALYRSPKSNAFIEDFETWERLDDDSGFPTGNYEVGAIQLFNDKLYLSLNDELYSYNETNLDSIHVEVDHYISYLTADGNNLLAGFYCDLPNCDGVVWIFDETENKINPPGGCINRPFHGIEDSKGRFWFADKFRNFRVTSTDLSVNCLQLAYDSPYTHNSEEIEISEEGTVFVASGGVRNNFGYLNRLDGVFYLNDNDWNRYAPFEIASLNSLRDFYDVVYDDNTGKLYMAAYLGGLAIKDGDDFEILHKDNSSLESPPGDPSNTRVAGIALDEEGLLWMANYGSERPISVLKPDGSTQSFRPADFENKIHEVVIDEFGNKWFASADEVRGILVFNEEDINVNVDDQSRVINSVNSNLPSNKVNCLAIDLDGDVWVGTEQGPVVFECGPNVFDEACIGTLRVVEVDSILANLLETENIKTIAVDGANRKWFGTDNGIFVQSPNGEDQVAYINKNNSPLFSNIINDIEINNTTGEVFIATELGLQSFQTDATEGGIVNTSDVVVYPNPVRPDYQGPIAIKGLARDADIKITDINGQLVYETKANGGQAIWDGNDYNGRRANTGVYLVFSTGTKRIDNPDAIVAKILLVN